MMKRIVSPEPMHDITPPDLGQVHIADIDTFGKLEVTIHGDPTSKATMVQFMPWSEYGTRPDARARHGVMAKYFGGRIITLGTPGIGPGSSGLSAGLRHDVRRGNLDEVARIQTEALMQVAPTLGSISLFGYSMGTVLEANFVQQARGVLDIKHATLAEIVANRPTNKVVLGTHLVYDALARADYRRTNPAWYRKLAHPLPSQLGALDTYTDMLACGGQFDENHFEGIPTLAVSCSQSSLLRPADADKLAERLNADQLVLAGHNHSFIDNLGNMAWLASYLKDIDN